jgi:hypothetical protein
MKKGGLINAGFFSIAMYFASTLFKASFIKRSDGLM